jgi:aerobic-type carbon monoxide dehydrogenase small subunit (CoxS/CutS family)
VSTSEHPVTITVNGAPHSGHVEARQNLAEFLRGDLHLTGTKLGCEQGVCGACTVLVDGEPVRACLMLAVQASGHEVRTVEGLASEGRLSVLQQAFTDNHALQCGFCTPGFLMTAQALLDENPDPTELEIRDALAGGICRCTGYDGLVAAVGQAAQSLRDSAALAAETLR